MSRLAAFRARHAAWVSISVASLAAAVVEARAAAPGVSGAACCWPNQPK